MKSLVEQTDGGGSVAVATTPEIHPLALRVALVIRQDYNVGRKGGALDEW